MLTVEQVADRFGVNRRTVFNWRQRGLKAIRPSGSKKRGKVLFRETDIERFLEKSEI